MPQNDVRRFFISDPEHDLQILQNVDANGHMSAEYYAYTMQAVIRGRKQVLLINRNQVHRVGDNYVISVDISQDQSVIELDDDVLGRESIKMENITTMPAPVFQQMAKAEIEALPEDMQGSFYIDAEYEPIDDSEPDASQFNIHRFDPSSVESLRLSMDDMEKFTVSSDELDSLRACIEPYVRAMDKNYYYEDYEVDTGDPDKKLRHYKGVNGEFDYDPSQFELMLLDTGESSQFNTKFEMLRFIGDPNDPNIHIPDGLRFAPYLFSGTDIQKAPKLPKSLESCSFMFSGCQKLEEADIELPLNCEDADFMFSGCSSLKKGPSLVGGFYEDESHRASRFQEKSRQFTIGGSVKSATYMFADCPVLQNTPRLGDTLMYADGMFANCKSLHHTPKFQKNTVSINGATYGCDGLDEAKDEEAKRRHEQAAKKYQKKEDKRTKYNMNRGAAMAALLQRQALRRMGYSGVQATQELHKRYADGTMRRNFLSAIADHIEAGKNPMGHSMAETIRSHVERSDKKREMDRVLRLERWTRAHDGIELTERQFKKATSSASHDYRHGLLDKAFTARTCSYAAAVLEESHGFKTALRTFTHNASKLESLDAESVKSQDYHQTKKDAKFMKDQLVERVAYLTDMETLVRNDRHLTRDEKETRLLNLRGVRDAIVAPIVTSIAEQQQSRQLFNEGDMRDIDRLLQKVHVNPISDQLLHLQGTYVDKVPQAAQQDEMVDDVDDMMDEVHMPEQPKGEQTVQSEEPATEEVPAQQEEHQEQTIETSQELKAGAGKSEEPSAAKPDVQPQDTEESTIATKDKADDKSKQDEGKTHPVMAAVGAALGITQPQGQTVYQSFSDEMLDAFIDRAYQFAKKNRDALFDLMLAGTMGVSQDVAKAKFTEAVLETASSEKTSMNGADVADASEQVKVDEAHTSDVAQRQVVNNAAKVYEKGAAEPEMVKNIGNQHSIEYKSEDLKAMEDKIRNGSKEERRRMTALCYGNNGIPVETVKAWSADKDPKVREAAMLACAERLDLDPKLVRKTLSVGLADKDLMVQNSAVRASYQNPSITVNTAVEWVKRKEGSFSQAAEAAFTDRYIDASKLRQFSRSTDASVRDFADKFKDNYLLNKPNEAPDAAPQEKVFTQEQVLKQEEPVAAESRAAVSGPTEEIKSQPLDAKPEPKSEAVKAADSEAQRAVVHQRRVAAAQSVSHDVEEVQADNDGMSIV